MNRHKDPAPGLVALDTETYLVRDSLIAPPLVCVSWADTTGAQVLLDRADGLDWFRRNIRRDDVSWVGHNVAYDMVVLLNAAPDTTPFVFAAYLDGRVHDTMIREMLLLNATGAYANVEPGLVDLVKRYLNRDRSAQKKGGDVWRKRYDELDGTPVDQWPADARSYALDDAADTLRVALAQAKTPRWVHASGRNVNLVRPDGSIVNEAEQVRAALALQLMSAYGLRVDQEAAQQLQEQYQREADALALQLVHLGLKRADGSTDTKAVKRQIIAALTAKATREDRAAVAQAVRDARTSFEAGEAALVAQGERKKGRDWTATKEHLAEVSAWRARGFDIPVTSGGAVTTGAEILETIDDDAIELLVQYDAAYKRLTTYLEPMRNAGDRALCPRYGVLKRSGRTSSSGPNVQNFPRKGGERECFVPRDGYLYVAVDYSTLELRAWAQVCLDLGIASEMARALRDGRDLHADLGAQMMSKTYDDFLQALEGAYGSDVKKRAKLFRGAAKPANFGLPVGMGAAKFEESARKSYGVNFADLGVTADDVRAAWYERWTEARPYFDHVKGLLVTVGHDEVVLEDGTTELREVRKCAIQHPRSGRVRGGCFFTDAANSYFQGMAADGAKEALFRVALECYADPASPLFGCRPVAFIHDEIILEAPGPKAQSAAARLVDVMVAAMEVFIPDVPILCDATIMDRWAKGAESKTQADGTLSVYWTEVEALRVQAEKIRPTDLDAAALLERDARALQSALETILH